TVERGLGVGDRIKGSPYQFGGGRGARGELEKLLCECREPGAVAKRFDHHLREYRRRLTGAVTLQCKTVPMRLYRDRAVVLRQHKLGEADRIVTLLTREHGLVRAVAKGVRRTRSKFGARLEPFAHIDVQLHPGRNLDIVTQVASIDAFATDIVSDYGRYT